MKCSQCGKKVFKNIIDKDGKIGRFRICANCSLLHIFGWDVHKDKKEKGVFEYDFEN